jgi:uncharacterized protein (DUF1800 family)
LDAAVAAGPGAAVARLCEGPGASPERGRFEQTVAMLANRTVATGNPQQLPAWWLFRMVNTPDPLLEKLTLFWHGHFATSVAKVEKPKLVLDQNELLRAHARGRFEAMVRAISRDPAMLIYLDSTTNRRIRPNENFAREVMELFCLGVGNYTEQDIKELARAFTGWEVLGDKFHYNRVQHDTRGKTFLGATGNFDGDEAVRVVLGQPAAPRFIARKLIKFFVMDEAGASDALVGPVAETLRNGDFEIGPAVKQILSSNLFYSEHAIGRKVRSPVELGVGLLRSLGATSNLNKLAAGCAELGQTLFYPPNVKGWDGGRAWINSSTLLGRANFVRQIMQAGETRYVAPDGSGATASLAQVAEAAGATTPEATVDWLIGLLVAAPVPGASRDVLLDLAKNVTASGDRSTGIGQVVHAISTLPEFQLS